MSAAEELTGAVIAGERSAPGEPAAAEPAVGEGAVRVMTGGDPAAEVAAGEKKAAGKKGKGAVAPAASGGKKAKPVEMKIEGEFYSLVKGKQFDLRNGRLIFRLASGVPAIAEEWLNTLTAATTTM